MRIANSSSNTLYTIATLTLANNNNNLVNTEHNKCSRLDGVERAENPNANDIPPKNQFRLV